MALILGYDTETTGLDVRKDYVLEVGAAIYDTETKQIHEPFDKLILWPARPVITPKIEKLTGINQKMVEKWGIPPEEAFTQLFRMADQSDYVCAHNGYLYDRPITETAIHKIHDPSDTLKRKFFGYKWMDSQVDLPYPDTLPTRSLKYCAMEHGYIMSTAHRAIFDVFALLHLVKSYPWDQITEILASPLELQAVKCDWTEKEKHQNLRDNGFHFDGPSKTWQRMERKYFSKKRETQLQFDMKPQFIPVSEYGQQLPKQPAQLSLGN